MTKSSLAQPARTVPESIRSRVLRGIKLHQERADEIEPQGKGVYRIPGGSGFYRVNLAIFEGDESCSCPDFRRHHLTCKHIACATLHRSKVRAAGRRVSRVHRHSLEAIEANLARLSA